jgi:hypothetical protein
MRCALAQRMTESRRLVSVSRLWGRSWRLPQARNVRRLRTPIVVGAIPVVVAIGGWITNLLTSGWNWWLFGVLAVVVGLSSVLAIAAETASERSPAVDPAPGRPAVNPPPPVWLDVPSRSRHFTGRDDLLAHLDVQPENGSGVTALVPHALYGLGGWARPTWPSSTSIVTVTVSTWSCGAG